MSMATPTQMVDYISRVNGLPAGGQDPLLQRRIDIAEADIGWVCGAPPIDGLPAQTLERGPRTLQTHLGEAPLMRRGSYRLRLPIRFVVAVTSAWSSETRTFDAATAIDPTLLTVVEDEVLLDRASGRRFVSERGGVRLVLDAGVDPADLEDEHPDLLDSIGRWVRHGYDLYEVQGEQGFSMGGVSRQRRPEDIPDWLIQRLWRYMTPLAQRRWARIRAIRGQATNAPPPDAGPGGARG